MMCLEKAKFIAGRRVNMEIQENETGVTVIDRRTVGQIHTRTDRRIGGRTDRRWGTGREQTNSMSCCLKIQN